MDSRQPTTRLRPLQRIKIRRKKKPKKTEKNVFQPGVGLFDKKPASLKMPQLFYKNPAHLFGPAGGGLRRLSVAGP